MENLIFCLNATIPLFLLMILGYLFMKRGLFTEDFVKTANTFVFRIALPVLVFSDLAAEDFAAVWNTKFVLFCFIATALSITISFLLSFLCRSRRVRGEFIQASYRSSAALLGISFIQNIYGDSGMAPLMIIGTVPLYNIMAVVVLSLSASWNETEIPECSQAKAAGNAGSTTVGSAPDANAQLKKTLLGILTNPILIGILVGLLWSYLRIPRPVILKKVCSSLGATAAPLGLMAMGAGFKAGKVRDLLKPALAATFLKLCGFCGLFLPVAIHLGFRNDYLVAILVMLGSPTTVSAYVMAKMMGHDGDLTTSTVMLTSLLSAFSITGWLFILRSCGYV